MRLPAALVVRAASVNLVQQVAVGVLQALLDHRAQVFLQLGDALGEGLHPVGVAAPDEQQLFGQGADELAVVGFDAHHCGDDQQRQRGGVVPHHIHAAPFLGFVQKLLDGRLHQRAPQLHRLGREVAVDDLPHIGVVGAAVFLHLVVHRYLPAVALDEPLAEKAAHILVQPHIRLVNAGVRGQRVAVEHLGGEGFGAAGHPDQVLVLGDDPQLVGVIPVHRVLLPHSPEVSIRVLDDLRGKQVFIEGGNHSVLPFAMVRRPAVRPATGLPDCFAPLF